MVVLAERFARADGEDRMRPALATISALSCLSFACIIVLSSAALTIALAVMVVVAAALLLNLGVVRGVVISTFETRQILMAES